MSEIKGLAEDVAKLRKHLEYLNSCYKYRYQEFLDSTDKLREEMDENKKALGSIEARLRALAIKRYEETGEKKFEYGVGVRVKEIPQYDPEQAFKWAKTSGLALSLNKKAFEKIAKVSSIEFVTFEHVTEGLIPQKIEVEKSE